MTASTFGAAFDALPGHTQTAILHQLRTRRRLYTLALTRGYSPQARIILLGDKPGPGRPTDPDYHHTPFYSTKNSSLWLNRQLVEAGIDENCLVWFNTELANGESLDPIFIQDLTSRGNIKIICLGNRAEMWMRRNAPTSPYSKVPHPQFAKRFKSKEPYELIPEIVKALDHEDR